MTDQPKNDSPAPSEPAKKPKPKVPAAPVKKDPAEPDKAAAPARQPAPDKAAAGAKPPAPARKPAAPAAKPGTPAAKPAAPAARPAAPAGNGAHADTVGEGITTEVKPQTRKAAEGIVKEPKAKGKAKAKEQAPPPKIAVAGVWGIDLGQCSLKAIRLELRDDQPVATAFDYIEHPKILSQPDADPDQLTREALEKFLSRNNLRGDTVCISVPGQSGLSRFVKLPPVEEKKITDIVRFEAKQQIPFNLDEVVWDYQKIGAGSVTDGFAMDTEIGLFAMKRELVNRALQQFVDLGIEVHYVQMAPLALCNFVAFDLLGKGGQATEPPPEEEEKKCIVGLDIGADGSSLVITDGERIIWQRSIPIGGNHFTRALTKDLRLTFAKAEHLKRNATKSPDLKKILASLKPVLNDFVGEVQRSLGYFTNTHRSADLEYIVGLGNAFRLPGLQRYLEEKLQLPVKKLQKMERLTGEKVVNEQAYTENVMSFAVVYGLAVQGLERSRLTTNLLPGDVRFQRLVKAKKPWAAAAAAVLLLCLGTVVLAYGLDYRAFDHNDVRGAEKEADRIVGVARANQVAFDKAKKEAEDEKNNVNSILAGQAERLHWLEMQKFLSGCVPQPNGSNVCIDPVTRKEYDPENRPRYGGMTARQLYWDKKPVHEYSKLKLSGSAAYGAMAARQNETGPKGSPEEDKEKERKEKEQKKKDPGSGNSAVKQGPTLPPYVSDLTQVNIEAVECRFCDDLDGFWSYLRANIIKDNKSDVHPVELADTPPSRKGVKESGWVVEVRGFTFHHQGRNFLNHVLCENIVRHGMPGYDEKDPAQYIERDPKKAPVPDQDPILNHIFHVVLLPAPVFGDTNRKTEDTETFTRIHRSYLDYLIRKAASASQPAPGPPVGAGGLPQKPAEPNPGRLRENWFPASGERTAATSIEQSLGDADERASLLPKGDAEVVERWQRRTEFVLLFIWKEPTPSDQLRGWPPPAKPSGVPAPGQPAVPGQPAAPGQPAGRAVPPPPPAR